jgi:2-amino-4-hydroxy-6-hydroxymethyldihydropteridine diphosphokinase
LTLCLVSVGSNIQPERFVPRAIEQLRQRLGPVKVSSAYRTVPVGDTAQPDFWNLAVIFETELSPEAINAELHAIERHLGRSHDPSRPWGPRAIDLDLVLLGDLVGRFGAVELPSPQLAEQAFVAVPAAELAPRLKHPLLGVTLAELAVTTAAACDRPPRRVAEDVR